MSSRRFSATLAVAVLLAVAACSGDADPGEGAPTSSASSEPSTGSGDDLPEGFGEGPPGKGLQRFYDQQVSWSECEDDGDECASFWVPLDYADPDGVAITVRARKQPAGDDSQRRGSIFINPGGPGGSGIDYVGYAGFDPSITDMFDVVGFDPRGVGQSTPVDCLTDPDLDAFLASDPSPDDDAEIAQFEEDFQTYVDGCVQKSGVLLEHVSTVEVARDMDIMRAVVGDEKLTFFGASYGTYIGATYAGLFPDQVDRMVLDGAVDPLADPTAAQLKQVLGFETALTAYLEDCVAQGGCPLGDDVDSARQTIIDLMADIDAAPLPTADGRDLTEGLAFLGFVLPLYDASGWPTETIALSQALKGRGDTLLALSDLYARRDADGSYSSNNMEVQSPVNCLDHPQDESLDDIVAGGPAVQQKAPVFGGVGMWFPYGCSNWPVTAAEPAPDFSAPGAAPIVVVGTTRDPATPYQQAVRLAAELESGVLLSRDGDGHTAYGRGNTCIDTAINIYLTTGTPPADGTRC